MSMTAIPAEGYPRPPLWRRPLYRAVQKVQRNVWGRVFLDVGGDPQRTLYLAGSGRSGTTWVAEVLNYRNQHRFLFEPLTPPHVPAFGHFRRGQYLRPGNGDPRYREPLEAMLTGRMRHPWIDRYNRIPIANTRLIKDVYANLLLKWVHVTFPGIHIVFVVRHPMAVLTSRLLLAPVDAHQRFEPDLERFLAQDDLVADFLEPFRDAIMTASTTIERQAFWWCIENFVPLRQFAPGEIHVLCYERLKAVPAEEIPGLGAFLGHDFHPSIYTKLRRHSRTTGPHSSLQVGGDPSTAWTHRWSREDVLKVVKVLSIFGLDEIYTDNPMPRAQGVATVLEASCASSRPA